MAHFPAKGERPQVGGIAARRAVGLPGDHGSARPGTDHLHIVVALAGHSVLSSSAGRDRAAIRAGGTARATATARAAAASAASDPACTTETGPPPQSGPPPPPPR